MLLLWGLQSRLLLKGASGSGAWLFVFVCVCVCQLTPVSRDTTLFYCTKLRRGAMDHYHSLPNEDSDSLVVISRRDAIWTYLQGF